MSFKIVCNKEHKGVICKMTSRVFLPKALVLQDECFGTIYSSFLDFTCNYERTSGIFVPCFLVKVQNTLKAKQSIECIIVCLFDSLCPSQNFFSFVEMGPPGLNQYIAQDKVTTQ